MSLPLARPIVYLITLGNAQDASFRDAKADITGLVRIAVEQGVNMVQLREKILSAGLLFELAAECAQITKGSQTKLLINDRVDIAIEAGADGVHLPEKSIPAESIRQAFGDSNLIATSVHSREAAIKAARSGADLIVFGPVFDTPGKSPAVGLAALEDVCEAVRPFPVIGLGGIAALNCRSVVAAGAAGIAAIRGLQDRASIESMMMELRS